MAMFLSRIKQILNLGTKSITANGTYNASTDGYDGYSSVEVNVAGVTPTPITPSNANPAALTSGTAVSPTANGYAIESYNTKTPSNSSPAVLESGEIDKIGGNGYAIQSYDMVMPSSTPTSVSAFDVIMIGGSGVIVDSIPTPPSITPSNASPAALTSGSAVTPTANGYAIESYSLANPEEGTRMTSGNFYKPTANGLIIDDIETLAAGSGTADTIVDGKNYHAVGSGIAIQGFTSITPSNSSPVSLSSGNYYKPSASGYAISSYSSKTPSDSSPASVSSGAIIKASSSGYLYSTVQPKVKVGTVTLSSNSTTKINCGFKPKYIALMVYKDTTHYSEHIYNSDANANYTFRGAINGASSGAGPFNFPTTSTSTSGVIMSTDSTGFTVAPASTAGHGTNGYYFAIG